MNNNWKRIKFSNMLVCAISGFPPEDPVVSKYGNIFERKLIVDAISTTGKCPVTGGDLTIDDLTTVNAGHAGKSLPVDSSKLSTMIEGFSAEWSRTLLHSYELKSSLANAEEELAKALYENEASVRLISQLTRERDEAHAEVNRLQEELAQLHYSMDQ